MIFNAHSDLRGSHAFLSASKYHWINYDNDRLDDVYRNWRAAARGIELHAFAHNAINLGIKLPRTDSALNMYVNDAIGFGMTTEQVLWYSENCYGTADTIGFRRNTLRIHDFKSGVIPGSIHQVEVYAALFCLEYDMKPGAIKIELRVYQDDNMDFVIPDIDVIAHIMSKIITFDKRIEQLKAEG